jgi:hypothetical protein
MNTSKLLIAAQCVFAVVFVALAVSNVSLRRQLAAEKRVRIAKQARFFEGDVIPRFTARDRARRPVELSGAAEAGRVLVMFIPGCDACEQVLRRIAANPHPSVTVVSLMSERTARDAARNLDKVPVYFVDDVQQSALRSRARVVPQILRVDGDGKVAEVCATYEQCIQHAAGI